MMGGGTFIPLKTRPGKPESAKQAKRRLTGLLQILHSRRLGDMRWLYPRPFAGEWKSAWNRIFCYLDHGFEREKPALSGEATQEKDHQSID
jgi:hypothetical protein